MLYKTLPKIDGKMTPGNHDTKRKLLKIFKTFDLVTFIVYGIFKPTSYHWTVTMKCYSYIISLN